ncbi:MAG: ATP-binding protein, partial [Proteobacteria bacterium]|nr:ATP-binding protein [Pseudomonadota bacterium]
MHWKNLRLSRKMTVIMGALLCALLLMSGMFVSNLHKIERETQDIIFAAGLNTTMLNIEIGHWRWVAALENYVLHDPIETPDAMQEDPRQCALGKWYYGSQRAMAEHFAPSIAEPLRVLEKAHNALHASLHTIKQYKQAGDTAEAHAVFETISMHNMQIVQNNLTQISATMREDVAKSIQTFHSHIDKVLTATLCIVLFAALLALFMGMIMTRSITEPVLRIVNYMEEVSSGNFDAPLIMRRRDELGHLADNLKNMVANFMSMMLEVKAQEQRTREGEELVRRLLDTTPIGVTLRDREYNIVECNQEIMRMFGFANKSDFIKKFSGYSPEFQPDGMASAEKRIELYHAAFETGYQKCEWMYRLTSGDDLPANITLVRVPWKDDWCVATYVYDLRETKAHEQKMREAREHAQHLTDMTRAAQLASQAKSEFLARMSHELRTPLNAAIGFLGLELQKDLPQETCEHMEIALDACYTLLSLISDILDISKIEAGRFELTNNNYRFVHLINEIFSLHSFRQSSLNQEAKPLVFNLEVNENLPSQFCGDDQRIKQVLNNLLSNAFKYTEKGMVTFSVECAPFAPGEEERPDICLVRFSIQDTGQGIKAENLKNLFTSYTRFDSKTNRFIEGTGLGLAISKNLVEMMDGQMEVKSEYGVGSDFACVIPQVIVDPTPIGRVTIDSLSSFSGATSQRGNKHRRSQPCSYLPYARVLVADDVQTNLDVARAMLKRYGITVDCVTSGQEAVDLILLGEPHYNMVFMDHMMPGMDGVEALCRIRAIDSDYARSLPVIVLTANVVAGNEKM